jgi:transposase
VRLAARNTQRLTNQLRLAREPECLENLTGRRDSGESQPEMNISKEGDRYLRTMLVQGAHYILGPFGADSDLRRWGLKLAARGGKSAKKRAVVAVARKLAVLLHRLWVSGEVYEPLRNSQKAMRAAAWSEGLPRKQGMLGIDGVRDRRS